MIKLAKLTRQIESFYKKAIRALAQTHDIGLAESYIMPDDPDDVDNETGGESGADLITESERFDIKDEELFNLFENFMKAYEDLIDTINDSNPKQTNFEELSTIAQLLETLNTRGRRISTSSHLNVNDDYSEDFDPGDLIAFVEKVYLNAKKRTDALSDDFDEIKQNQYQKEFDDIREEAEEKGGKEAEWMARKQDANKKHSAEHRDKMKVLKKLNPEEWSKWYEAEKEKRRAQYKAMMANPQKAAEYRAKSNARRQRWLSDLVTKQQHLQSIIPTLSGHALEEAKAEFAKITGKLEKFKQRQIEDLNTRHKLWKTEDLAGAVQNILTKTDSELFERKERARRAVFEANPAFQPLKDALALAKDNYNAASIKGPTVKAAAKTALSAAQTALKNAMLTNMRNPEVAEAANKHPKIVEAANELSNLKQYAKMIESVFFKDVKKKDRAGMIGNIQVTEQLKSQIQPLVAVGQNLIAQYKNKYPLHIERVDHAVKYLRSMLGDQ